MKILCRRHIRTTSRRRARGWALALLLLGLPLPTVQGQPQGSGPSFEVSAQVPTQDDPARARARALLEAMSQALEQAVTQAAPEARGRLYLLSARARDYITTYRVLEEGETAGQFALRLEAQVDLPRLLRDLQGTLPAGRQASPRRAALLLCATPSGPDAGGPGAPSEAGVAAVLDKARALLAESGETVELVSPALCSAASASANPAALSKSPAHALLMLTLDGGAPAQEVRGTLPRLLGALGRVTFRALRLNAAAAGSEALLSETAEAAAFAPTADSAAAEAQQRAALLALGQLLKRPGVLPYSGSAVLVSIWGAGSYPNYQQLLRVLGALPGVSRAEPRRFLAKSGPAAAPTEDLVQVLVHTTTSPEALGAALGRTPLSGLRLQVVPQGAGELKVVCAPGSALPAEGLPEAPPPEVSEPVLPAAGAQ